MSGNSVLDLPLHAIERVTFYKRDEITSDLICCEILTAERTHFAHETWVGWPQLIKRLERLPTFDFDWFSRVSQPPFEACETVAYQRTCADPSSDL